MQSHAIKSNPGQIYFLYFKWGQLRGSATLASPLLPKQLPDVAAQRLTDLLQGLDGSVLNTAFEARKGGLTDAEFAGKGVLGLVAA